MDYCFICWTRHKIKKPIFKAGLCKECNQGSHPQKTPMEVTSKGRFLTWGGKTLNLAQWSKWVDIKVETIESRLRKGWSVKKTLSTPVKKQYRNKEAK